MSESKRAAAEEPEPVSEAARKRLLPGWEFFHARPGMVCWLCREPACYLTKNFRGDCGWCLRHARDF